MAILILVVIACTYNILSTIFPLKTHLNNGMQVVIRNGKYRFFPPSLYNRHTQPNVED